MKIVFSGCSYTAGNGWTDTQWLESGKIEVKDSPHLWVNLCHQNIDEFRHLELINVAKCGASNTDIFTETARAMAQYDDIDTVFCQWTSMPRYNWNVGFELWPTDEDIMECEVTRRTHDVGLNRGDTWPRSYIDDLTNRLLVMHHLHWEILKVVDYSNILKRTARRLGIAHVYFVNGLCPWDQDYFTRLDNVMPEQYTPFTKKEILNIETRDDTDIHTLYHRAHDHYDQHGGIDPDDWINLYGSFHEARVDRNYDGHHPGQQSNIKYYEMVRDRLCELEHVTC